MASDKANRQRQAERRVIRSIKRSQPIKTKRINKQVKNK